MKTIGFILFVALAATAFASATKENEERSDMIPWCGTKVRNHATFVQDLLVNIII